MVLRRFGVFPVATIGGDARLLDAGCAHNFLEPIARRNVAGFKVRAHFHVKAGGQHSPESQYSSSAWINPRNVINC